MKRIAIIQGHPDPKRGHLCHALAEAYATGARHEGHELRLVEVSQLSFPLLGSQQAWESGAAPAGLRAAQETIAWAEHLVIIFPLWLGDMPALLKGFFEQVLRPGFAIGEAKASGRMWAKLLKGKSARIIVTMGMPAFFYRLYYRAHSVKSLERNILRFCGVAPVRTTLIGTVGGGKRDGMEDWIARVSLLGRAAR
jgi:putative NADPH-quinone reductase